MSPIHKGHKAMPKGKHKMPGGHMMPNKEMGKHMVEKKAKPKKKGKK